MFTDKFRLEYDTTLSIDQNTQCSVTPQAVPTGSLSHLSLQNQGCCLDIIPGLYLSNDFDLMESAL